MIRKIAKQKEMASVVGHPVHIYMYIQSRLRCTRRDGKETEGIRETSREERDISRGILGCNQLEFLPECVWLALL